jgi:A/G-specific adenine glycosylase
VSVQISGLAKDAIDGDFAGRILGWYDRAARDLPWRIAPGDRNVPDPYRVWLAEIMLQQTTVAAVAGYFERFTRRWPTVHDLAAADDADIMAAWAGLGYYARARNLLACARVVVQDHGGLFPDSEAALRALPGIGDYTAASVAAIAFGRPAVVIDANIERVIARHRLIETPLPMAKREIRTALAPLVPEERPGDFAQALMDLGATICTSRGPACAICPVMADCCARGRADIDRLPVKPPKKAKPHRHGLAYWIERDAQVWLVRRPDKGMLGGMRALPGGDWSDAPPAAGEGEWWPISDLDGAGLPTLYRKLVDRMLERDA